MDAIGPLKNSAKFMYLPQELPPPDTRNVAMVSTGPHLVGSLQPHPDNSDAKTLEAGARKRAAAKTPEPDPEVLARATKFVAMWLNREIDPLDGDTDTTYESWRPEVNQPEWRKIEYDEAYEKVMFLLNEIDPQTLIKELRVADVGGFGKDETYPEFKHERCINARDDLYKVLVGPFYRLIEKKLFSRPEFIKKVPVKDRPRVIFEALYRPGATYIATDYKRYEASFVSEVQWAFEFQLYIHMMKGVWASKWFAKLSQAAQLSINKILYHFFIMWIRATRMSGEMCTSLGNGFTNLMAEKFVAHESGVELICFVEGDDGLAAGDGKLKEELFQKLGFEIKLQYFDDLCSASFCGLIFDPEDLINITDPVKVLQNIAWVAGKYAKARIPKLKALLRVKGLSMLYQYPGCPIVQEMALYILRVTAGIDVRPAISKIRDTYEREKLERMMRDYPSWKDLVSLVQEPPMRTRLLMEQKFGVCVTFQLDTEAYFRCKNDLKPVELYWIRDVCHPDTASYFDRYVLELPLNVPFNKPFLPYAFLYPYEF